MPHLIKQIQTDTYQALKNHDPEKVSTLRLLMAALKNEQIALRCELTDQNILVVIHRLIKQRQDAAEFYQSAGQIEKEKHELAEVDYLNTYLPPALSTEAINRVIAETAQTIGATSIISFGQLMKAVMTKTQGQTNGVTVKQQVENYLKQHASG